MTDFEQTSAQVNLFDDLFVYVDQCKNLDIQGKYFTAGGGIRPFSSFGQLMLELEDRFDNLDYPQAEFETHSFSPVAGKHTFYNRGEAEDWCLPKCQWEYNSLGGRLTFLVKIRFRQNASWQGTVSWLEQKKNSSFRSAMELFKLIRGAAESQAIEPDFSVVSRTAAGAEQ